MEDPNSTSNTLPSSSPSSENTNLRQSSGAAEHSHPPISSQARHFVGQIQYYTGANSANVAALQLHHQQGRQQNVHVGENSRSAIATTSHQKEIAGFRQNQTTLLGVCSALIISKIFMFAINFEN